MKATWLLVVLGLVSMLVLDRKPADPRFAPPLAPSIKSGIYHVRSDGYDGAATLRRHGDGWLLASSVTPSGGTGSAQSLGIGFEQDGQLFIGWMLNGVPGVTVFKIEAGGKLTGEWIGGSGEKQTETLELLKELR